MMRTRTLDGRPAFRLPGGALIRTSTLWAMAALVLATLLVALPSVLAQRSPGNLLPALHALLIGSLPADEQQLLWELRLPRLLVAWLCGWSVAVPGALLQALTRNPLADPGLLGLSQGAVTVVMLLLIWQPDIARWLTVAAALGGGMAMALLLAWLAGLGQHASLATLLMGIALESVLSAVTAILLLYLPGELSVSLSEWLAGSLFLADWSMVAFMAQAAATGLIGIILLGRRVRLQTLGPEMAMALGDPVHRTRPLLLGLAVLLNTASVVAIGPLSLLGVLAPWLAGRLASSRGGPFLILSGLSGGLLVVVADFLSQRLLDDSPIPIGLALTLIGVPSFIGLLRFQALHERAGS